MCQSRFSCRTSRSRTIMRIILEVSVLAMLPLAAFGTDSRLYRTDPSPSRPYQPPRPQYPSPQRDDYYPPLAQHPQPDLSCCRSNYPGKRMKISKLATSPHQRLVVGCTYNFQTLPEEHGSCRVNADCTQKVSPYCSGFGYCTQITQYGQGGCSPCEGTHYHQR